MNTFGENMRKVRNDRGLSMDALADMVGTTKQVLSRYETGKRVPKISMAVKIADALGVKVSDLAGTDDLAGTALDREQERLWQRREELRREPGRRILFNLAENGTDDDVDAVVKLIDALKATNPRFYDGDDPA